MTDIHCHILPHIDDGASSMDEALEMARMAVASGVTDMIATPHFRGEPGNYDLCESFRSRYEQLKAGLQENEIGIKLHLGAEVLCLPQTAEMAKKRQLPTLAGTEYVLIEFFFDAEFEFMDRSLEQIADCGYRIVVAHPERYGVIQHEPRLLERWASKGYVLQMNKGSILGLFGNRTQRTAYAMLEMGTVHLIASDAHSAQRRTTHMGQLRQWAKESCTPECAEILLQRNPDRVLRGKPMVGME